MKTIIKDLTGEMPVNESLHDNIANVLRTFDECTTTSRYGDAIESLIALFADKPKGKPIEFVKSIYLDGSVYGAGLEPSAMKSITLLCRNYGNKFDAMFAESIVGTNLIYLGHWNDGYVEGNDN